MLKVKFKILLTTILCMVMVSEASAATSYSCSTIPSCTDYGYTYRSGNCHLGFVACPFNPTLVKCDEEGAKDDFKYTLTPTAANGWTVATSTYTNRFIVGAYKSGQTKSYCGVTGSGTTLAQKYKSHTHPNGSANTARVTGTRHGATAGGKVDVWGSATYYNNYYLGKTSATIGDGTGDSDDLYPVHKKVRGYFYNGSGTSSPSSAVDISCDQRPSCEDLGYVDQTNNCPGTYVACPFDKTKVKCDLQAQAGEIKFSLQTADHNGWLKCNGRKLNELASKYAKSELASVLSKNSMTSLPNYSGVFLRVSSSTSNSQIEDNLPDHTHSMTVSEYAVKKDNNNVRTGAKDRWWYQITVNSPIVRDTPNTTGENSDGGTETRPPYYAANVFIYSGKLNQ